MSRRQRPVVLESTRSPIINGNTMYLSIDIEALRNAGIDPTQPDTVPDEIPERYYKGGDEDGVLEIDLKEAASNE